MFTLRLLSITLVIPLAKMNKISISGTLMIFSDIVGYTWEKAGSKR